MTSPDTLPGSSPEAFADGFENHPEPRLQQVGMAGPQHGFRQVSRIRAAEGDRAFPPVYVHHAAGDGAPHQPTHVGRGFVTTSGGTFWSINTKQPDPHLPEREGVPVHDARDADERRPVCDGWGPSSFDPFEWRPGDRDYGEQHQEWREQTDHHRPNRFRRIISRALDMGTPGEWAADFAATLTLAALFVCLFVFATLFS